MMMQGYNLEDVARGIDETMIRQPLGVVAAITPFNFPGMIPFWFLPYAIACGNTLYLKPSERVPLTMRRAFELLERTGLPKGVVNLVNGGKVRRRCPARSSQSPRHQLRRIDSGRQIHLCSRRSHMASARSARAAPRTTSSSCPTPTWTWPRKSSATALSVAPGSAAWRSPWRSRSAKRRKHFAIRSPTPQPLCRVGNGLDEGVQMGPVITRAEQVAHGITDWSR